MEIRHEKIKLTTEIHTGTTLPDSAFNETREYEVEVFKLVSVGNPLVILRQSYFGVSLFTVGW